MAGREKSRERSFHVMPSYCSETFHPFAGDVTIPRGRGAFLKAISHKGSPRSFAGVWFSGFNTCQTPGVSTTWTLNPENRTPHDQRIRYRLQKSAVPPTNIRLRARKTRTCPVVIGYFALKGKAPSTYLNGFNVFACARATIALILALLSLDTYLL